MPIDEGQDSASVQIAQILSRLESSFNDQPLPEDRDQRKLKFTYRLKSYIRRHVYQIILIIFIISIGTNVIIRLKPIFFSA